MDPKIPTLKDAQKPQVKVKGLGAGLTLFDRLKQFKKKDLAFILAGLGTLFMAPLAEHFMMAPENGSETMSPGFRGGSSGSGIFGSGSSPYESGNNGIAQGGAIGGAGDIITPLNVRDPSALVMGPGSSQQPPAGSVAPAAAPVSAPTSASTNDYKDALAGAASRAASAAVKKSPLPVPKVALGGSGLRGLGVAGGGSSASGGLGPIGGAGGGTAGTGGGGLNLVRATPGFRSAAGARGPGNPTGLDGTKKAGAAAGDAFSRTGSALSGLNAAASEQIPTGGQGFAGGGQGGAGANDKGPGGSGPGGSKNVGESLAFLAMKQRQEEALKLEFEKRRLKDPELLLYGIRNDSLKAMASEMTKSLTKSILSFMDPSAAANANAVISCVGGYQGMLSAAPMCSNDGKGGDAGGCVQKTNSTPPGYKWVSGQTQTDCRVTGGKDDSKASVTQTAPSTPIGPITGGWPTGDGKAEADKLVDNCKTVAANATDLAKKPEAAAKAQAAGLEALKTQMALLISARDALYGQEAASTVCGAENIRGDKSALNIHNDILISLLGDKGIKAMQASATSEKEDVREPATTVTDAVTAIGKAREKVNAAKAKLAGTEAKITAISFGQTKTDADPYRDSAAKAAKWLAGETAPDGYIGVINKSIDAIEKQLPHGKFAVVEAPKTVPLVAKMNKDYNVIDKAAKDIQLTPSAQTAASANPNPAPANGNPTAAPDAAQLAKDVEDKIGATPKPFSEATAAIKAVQENKDPKLAEGLKSTAQTKFDAANKAWYDAQTKQVGVLNTFTDGLKAIQNPPK